jgi:hypothetical protein
MTTRTTPAKVNKELEKRNVKHRFYRGNGYYYFIGGDFEVPSIYVYNLEGFTTDMIVGHYVEAEALAEGL